jgi:hypothetical protein
LATDDRDRRLVVNPPEDHHRSQYDPVVAQAVLGEAAGLIKALGFAAQHVALIGGIVPGLLVPVLDPGVDPHVGTTDLDVCLSVAIMEGTTGYYQKIQQTLKDAGFQPTEESWRWRGGRSASVVLEFFCPQPPGHPAGRPFRPPAERRRARANLGSQLSALALEAGAIIGEDVVEREMEVTLPDGRGRQQLTLRFTGPAGFLAAKASALKSRDKPKDAYDIVWLLEAWPAGPAQAAAAVRARPVWGRSEIEHALTILVDQFRDIDSAGARAYAEFIAGPGDDRDLLARRAAGAIGEFLGALAGSSPDR